MDLLGLGQRVRLPNGVTTLVMAPRPGLAAVAELQAPGGWGVWAANADGLIFRVQPGRRGGLELVDTTWCTDDLAEMR